MKRLSETTWVWIGVFYWIPVFSIGYYLSTIPIPNTLMLVYGVSVLLVFMGISITAAQNAGGS